uniref:Uncharacterized protein n=1 Tax=Pararge aegeria TaxID=116150 RepID=S4P4W2_9NEOP
MVYACTLHILYGCPRIDLSSSMKNIVHLNRLETSNRYAHCTVWNGLAPAGLMTLRMWLYVTESERQEILCGATLLDRLTISGRHLCTSDDICGHS